MKYVRIIGNVLALSGLYMAVFTDKYQIIGFWTMMVGASILAIWGFWWWKKWYFAK